MTAESKILARGHFIKFQETDLRNYKDPNTFQIRLNQMFIFCLSLHIPLKHDESFPYRQI